MDNFEKIKCFECDSLKLDIIEVDEYNEIIRIKCKECGYEFIKSVDKILASL